jgi:hypothetical protein
MKHGVFLDKMVRAAWREKRPSDSEPCAINAWGTRYKTPLREPSTDEFEMLHHDLCTISRIMKKHSALFDTSYSKQAEYLLGRVPQLTENMFGVLRPASTFEFEGYSVNRSQWRLVFVGDVNRFVEDVIDFAARRFKEGVQESSAWKADEWDLSVIEYNVKKLVYDMSPTADKHELPMNPIGSLDTHITQGILSAMSAIS